MEAAYEAYLEEDPVLPAFSEERPAADIAPLPAAVISMELQDRPGVASKILWMKETRDDA
jgi:hypothetical protein